MRLQAANETHFAMDGRLRIHEIGHVLLHHGGDDTERALREVEAECVAMICCESLGLTGVEYSRGYVQHWLCVDSVPEKAAQRIFQAADRILKAGMGSFAHEAAVVGCGKAGDATGRQE